MALEEAMREAMRRLIAQLTRGEKSRSALSTHQTPQPDTLR